MKISKMDHAMLSLGLLGGLLVPRSRPQGSRVVPPRPTPAHRSK
ncbi:MAG: hypothetical protein WC068_03350 [Caulobacter sp.]